MARDSLSNKIINNIPNKKVVISLFVVLITLTFGAMVALANENVVVVEADVLNVRYGPGLSHDVLTQVEESACKIPTIAEELCTITVSTRPVKIPSTGMSEK